MKQLRDLTGHEVGLVTEALLAVHRGPWLEGELQTRTGLYPEEFQRVIDHWPAERDGRLVEWAVTSALGEVGLGIRFTEAEWREWFSSSRDEFKALFWAVKAASRK